MDYRTLHDEIANDPATLGYSGKTDQQVADLLNDATKRSLTRTIIPAYEVLEATVPAEWASLTAQEKQRYQTIVGAGQVNVAGTNTRASLAAMFAAGTATRTALAALQTTTISRAAELGLGAVAAIDVTRAKGGAW